MSLWKPGVILPADKLTPLIMEDIKAALSLEQTLALTAWAEARSRLEPGRGWVPNPLEAMGDILNVVWNRSKDPRWYKLGLKGVCLARRQFSCWDSLGGASNYLSLLDSVQLLLAQRSPTGQLMDCLALAYGHSAMIDTLKHATHYYAPASMLPPGSVPPWVRGATMTEDRYGHRFFSNVR